MSKHDYRRHALISLLFAALLLVAACGVKNTAGADATPGASATPGAAATPTVGPATSCADIPGMQGAQSAEIFNTDLQGGLGLATSTITSPASATYEVVQYSVCVKVYPAGTVGNISAPFVSDTSSATAEAAEALNLKGRGWGTTTSFPFDGTTLTSCSQSQFCYTTEPQYYLELEHAVDHTHGVITFLLRLASPQPLVRCDPQLFPIDTYPSSFTPQWNAAIPLPPVTRVSGGYGDSLGITTYLCSAGTIAAIQAYMMKYLPKYGWTPLMVNGTQLWKAGSGGGPLYIRINPITDPRKWSILEYFPGTNLG
jgi:hypothetical protein